MKSGDACPRPACDGLLQVRNSRPSKSGLWQYRYLACGVCGEAPANNVQRVPADQVRRRKKAPNKVLSYTPARAESTTVSAIIETATEQAPAI